MIGYDFLQTLSAVRSQSDPNVVSEVFQVRSFWLSGDKNVDVLSLG
jgi:hypothetical protein